MRAGAALRAARLSCLATLIASRAQAQQPAVGDLPSRVDRIFARFDRATPGCGVGLAQGRPHALHARLRIGESRVRRPEHRLDRVRERLRRQAVHGAPRSCCSRRTASSRSTTTFENTYRRFRRSAASGSRSAIC